jgi:leucyl aminopeptidase (aminopeptidase T)
MIDTQTWQGVQSLLDKYAKVRTDDSVVMLFTSDSYEPAAWVSAALELREIPVRRVWMAPLRDDGITDRLMSALPSSTEVTGRVVVLTFERDTMSHTRTLAAALSKYKTSQCVVLRAISASSSLFSDALRVSPEELSARNTAVLERCVTASRLRIKTPGGSDLNVTIDTKHRWISNRGAARPGGVVILPAGEVATFPASINGVFVGDFAFNINAITDRDARLGEYPVMVWVRDGRAVRHACDDPVTSQFLEECLSTHCASNVGELGFGTNVGVVDAIAMNSHINERRPGVHLGFGQHNQNPGVVGYQCSIHLDLIARGGTIWVDEDPVPLDLEDIVPSARPHPTEPRDEDVFSPEIEELEVDDCCGILTGDGLQLFDPKRTE